MWLLPPDAEISEHAGVGEQWQMRGRRQVQDISQQPRIGEPTSGAVQSGMQTGLRSRTACLACRRRSSTQCPSWRPAPPCPASCSNLALSVLSTFITTWLASTPCCTSADTRCPTSWTVAASASAKPNSAAIRRAAAACRRPRSASPRLTPRTWPLTSCASIQASRTATAMHVCMTKREAGETPRYGLATADPGRKHHSQRSSRRTTRVNTARYVRLLQVCFRRCGNTGMAHLCGPDCVSSHRQLGRAKEHRSPGPDRKPLLAA